MKKIFTLLAAILVFAGIAKAEPVVQKTVLKIQDWFGEPVCTPYVVDLSYENGVYTIENFADSGVALSFTYDNETYMSSLCDTNLSPLDPEGDEYVLIDPNTGNGAEILMKNFMGEDETLTFYSPTFFKSSFLVFEDEKGPYIYCDMYALEEADDPDSFYDYWMLDMHFRAVEDDNAVGFTTSESAPVYYNLQGVRIDNPSDGMFIKKSGNTTTKVML